MINIKMYERVTNERVYQISDISINGVGYFGFSREHFSEVNELTNSVLCAYEYFKGFSSEIEFDVFVHYVDTVHNCGELFGSGKGVDYDGFVEWANETILDLY